MICDSTPGRINIKDVKANIDTNKEAVIFKRYPGQTAEEIAFYAPKPLSDIKPEVAMIIAGTNDLSKAVYTNGGTINENEVVKNIRAIAEAARDSGAQKIYISGVLVRWGHQYKNAIARVNNLLETMCRDENFIFMDQGDITANHISGDGIHPNFHGTTILKFNLLSAFDTFNPYISNFQTEYEKALF